MSSIGSALIFLSIYLSAFPVLNWVFAFIVAVLICCSLSEVYGIVREKGTQPLSLWAIVCTLFYVLATFSLAKASMQLFGLIRYSLYSWPDAFFTILFRGENPTINMALTVFGFVYLVLTLTCMVSINYLFHDGSIQDGRWWVFYLIAVTKMTDVGGYIVGKKFGTAKIVPFISPKKTVQGTVGGILFALLTSMAVRWFSGYWEPLAAPMSLSLSESIWLGGLIGLVSMFGDLSESLLKRDAKVKDSSSLPGLGGTLDVVDSLVFTAPLVYLFLLLEV